jgi:hypothetical protein
MHDKTLYEDRSLSPTVSTVAWCCHQRDPGPWGGAPTGRFRDGGALVCGRTIGVA